MNTTFLTLRGESLSLLMKFAIAIGIVIWSVEIFFVTRFVYNIIWNAVRGSVNILFTNFLERK